MPVFEASQNISVYISMHGEISTQEIIKTILEKSKGASSRIALFFCFFLFQ
jgi:5-formyltetrahydrofolate cyclo-ligase